MTEIFEGVEGEWVPTTHKHASDDPEWNKGYWRLKETMHYKDGLAADTSNHTATWERFVPKITLPTETGSAVIPPPGSWYGAYLLTPNGWINWWGLPAPSAAVLFWLERNEGWTVYDAGATNN